MKFCSECGNKLATPAKFCPECGNDLRSYGREAKSLNRGPIADFDEFIRRFGPRKNEFAEKNEAFDGYFYPATGGAVDDWVRYQAIDRIWTVLAGDEFDSIQCRSGYFSSDEEYVDLDNVLGYFVVEKEISQDEIQTFTLPANYSSMGSSLLLIKDSESDLWRPCSYLLKGDSSPIINLEKLDPVIDYDSEEWPLREIENSRFQRNALQVADEFYASEYDLEELLELLDSRYFYVSREPYSTDFFTEEYQPLYSYAQEWASDSARHILALAAPPRNAVLSDSDNPQFGFNFTIEETKTFSCATCEENDELEISDATHECLDADASFESAPSFSPGAKCSYFKTYIKLSDPISDEPEFRRKIVKGLFESFKTKDANQVEFCQRGETQMSNELFELVLGETYFGQEKLTKRCQECHLYNPPIAEVCYSCCAKFVKRLSGNLYACVNQQMSFGFESIKQNKFVSWVNIYYFTSKEEPKPISVSS